MPRSSRKDLDLSQLDSLPVPTLGSQVPAGQPGRAQPRVKGQTVGLGGQLAGRTGRVEPDPLAAVAAGAAVAHSDLKLAGLFLVDGLKPLVEVHSDDVLKWKLAMDSGIVSL